MTTRVRAGVLSAGAWSDSSHLPTLRDRKEVDLITVTRPDPNLAAGTASRFGAVQHTTDWRSALTQDLDAVVVSSPPGAHVSQVVAALESGANVLVEKPFALNLNDALVMLSASKRSRRHLLVGFGWVSSPIFLHAKAMVEEGELGQIEHVTMHLAVNTRALLSGSQDGGWGATGNSESSTYTDVAMSAGGSAAVSMSHQLGMLFWLTGERPTSITAQTYPQRTRSDLHAATLLSLSGGGNATLTCAATHPDSERPEWTIFLYGDRGQLHIESIADRLRLVRQNGSSVEPERVFGFGAYDAGAPTNALIDVTLGSSVPAGMSAAIGADVVRATDGLYESARSRSTVELNGWSIM